MGKDQSIDPDKYYRYVYMTGNTKEDKKLSMKGFHPCCWYKSLYPYTPKGYYPEEILPLYPEGVLGTGRSSSGYYPEEILPLYPEGVLGTGRSSSGYYPEEILPRRGIGVVSLRGSIRYPFGV